MTDTVVVLRKSQTQDAHGNVVTALVSTSYPCRLEASIRLPTDQQQAAGTEAVSIWNCYVPYGTGLLPSDRFSINGAIYELSDRMDANTDGAAEKAILRRVS